MRIAQISSHYYPYAGGGVIVVDSLSTELAKLGCDVHVFTLTRQIQKGDETRLKVHVHRLYSPSFPNPLSGATRIVLRELLGFDVVHVHSTHNILSIQAMFTAIVFRLPFVVGMLSVGDILRHPNIGKRLIGGFFEKIGLILAHHADVVNVKTLRDKINLINFGFPEDKIVVIPDGIPEDACKPVVVNDLCREYNLDDKKVVLYVGRLQYPKGLHILLKSVPVVLKDVPDAIFLLVGPDGGMKQILMALAKSLGIQNHIIFADYVSEQIKLQAYALCDMLVLPSLYDYVEAYSIVISEAWAQRKPVVATRIGAIPYRINHNVNGLLVPPGDVDKLAGAITKLLLDSSFARHLGENGSKEVVTWSEVAQRMMDIYQNLGNQNLVIETS